MVYFFKQGFWLFLGLTVLAFVARGLGILAGIPGGVFLAILGLAIAFGLAYGLEATRRF